MFFKRKKYVVVEFDNKAGGFDFPKRIRIPNIGERLSMETKYGFLSGHVLDVKTRVSRLHIEISIRVGKQINPTH